MCKNIGTPQCANDCGRCDGRAIHAPDAYQRFKKLKYAMDERGQAVALENQDSVDNK